MLHAIIRYMQKNIEELCRTLLLEIFSLGFISLVLNKLQTGWVCKLLRSVFRQLSVQSWGRQWGGGTEKRFCVQGDSRQLPLWDTLRDDEPPALLSLACMFGEALKTDEKESYMTQKIEISDIGIHMGNEKISKCGIFIMLKESRSFRTIFRHSHHHPPTPPPPPELAYCVAIRPHPTLM